MKTKTKNPAAVELGRLGGLAAAGAGMRARLKTMTKRQRVALARKAGKASGKARRSRS
jgi:hypothetical protein